PPPPRFVVRRHEAFHCERVTMVGADAAPATLAPLQSEFRSCDVRPPDHGRNTLTTNAVTSSYRHIGFPSHPINPPSILKIT
ncbi:hypothetical protein ACLUWV_08330, partial [Bifidobacterium thermophilum]|uniref:hypothetical protein n=1 Tax=Bifidobacterium thermophilum TaxID=33905 RepID=UPI0039946F45